MLFWVHRQKIFANYIDYIYVYWCLLVFNSNTIKHGGATLLPVRKYLYRLNVHKNKNGNHFIMVSIFVANPGIEPGSPP